jgi:hypothetical protein
MAYPTPPAYTGSKSQTSQGTSIWASNPTSPLSYVFIGETLGADFSDKAMFDDSSNLQSGAKEFLAVLPDPGKLDVDLNRVSPDPGQTLLAAAKANGTRLAFSTVFPINTVAGQATSGDQRNFLGYVETLSPRIKVNTKITTKFSVQISGPITEVPGS